MLHKTGDICFYTITLSLFSPLTKSKIWSFSGLISRPPFIPSQSPPGVHSQGFQHFLMLNTYKDIFLTQTSELNVRLYINIFHRHLHLIIYKACFLISVKGTTLLTAEAQGLGVIFHIFSLSLANGFYLQTLSYVSPLPHPKSKPALPYLSCSNLGLDDLPAMLLSRQPTLPGVISETLRR